jgi:hypothetical protein
MKKENGYFIDENNNLWSSIFETEESAEAKSKTLQNCRSCSDCSDCSSCSYCSDFKSNPQRYVSKNKIGTQRMQTTIYWSEENKQVIYGCFRGDLTQFETKVREKHARSEDLAEFLREIEIMKFLINQK